jgi:hypothetical protein
MGVVVAAFSAKLSRLGQPRCRSGETVCCSNLSCANFEWMGSKRKLNSEESLEKREKVSADRRETELESCDLENVRNAIQVADEGSRCRCDWDYATAHGMQRAHNPLCPVHDSERVVNAVPPAS